MPSNSRRKRNSRSSNEKTRKYKTQNGKRKTNKKTTTKKVDDSTKMYKATDVKKEKKTKQAKKHPKIKIAIKIILVLFLLMCVVVAGIVAGMFFGLFGDDFEITKEELKIGAANSVIVDQNGGVIANLSGDEKRKVITLEEMADYLPKAYVAIEDERFYKHSGVDFKRTAGAILHTVMGNSSYGGSTITQQLVKNITKDDESQGLAGIMRKVKEWAKAYQVERMISKDQILELYLNILYVGGEGNLHGVELGAQYYFNKSAKDLTLAECAFLAGINSSPNYYNPYKLYSANDTEEKRNERIKKKTLTVLSKMKELGYIENEEEYNEAVKQAEEGLTFTKGAMATGSGYSYHTDAVIEQVIAQVMEEKGISRQLAENYVYSSGLTIYSTVDATIQARVEEETLKQTYIKSGREKENGVLKNEQTQAAMVIIDHSTGNVLGVSGGLGPKTGANLNRGTQAKRQPGSSIKPIADLAPALEEKVITAATVYDDVLTSFNNGYKPKNDGHRYRGLINMRDIIAYSQNVPQVKIMKELTPSKSIDYLRKFGVSSVYKNGESNIFNDEGLPLAIGGLSEGISPLEMAAAYAAIANNGEYIKPTFYTKVVDSSGNTVLTPNQERTRVISEQNAYIVKSILQEPVRKGTATYCAISGIDVAAKTGTTDGSKDRWLCGFTPYYAAACWFGYDKPEEVTGFSKNPAGQIWDSVMTDIHKNLAKASFQRPGGIVQQTICKKTGCLATTGCTETYTEMFTSNNLPGKCQGHGTQTICEETGKLANEYCPTQKEENYGGTVPKEQLNLWKPVNGKPSTSEEKVEETCDVHKKPEEKPGEKPDKPEKPKENTTNTTNTANTTNTNTTNTNTTTNTTGNNTTGGNTNTGTNTSENTNTSGETGGTETPPDNDTE